MTIGALLLRRRRLSQLRAKLKRRDGFRLDAALAQHDELQREWRLHYEKKLKREVPSRLKVMAGFFRECSENPRDCAGAYPVEALRRTIVQEILTAMGEFGYEKSDMAASVACRSSAAAHLACGRLHLVAAIGSGLCARQLLVALREPGRWLTRSLSSHFNDV